MPISTPPNTRSQWWLCSEINGIGLSPYAMLAGSRWPPHGACACIMWADSQTVCQSIRGCSQARLWLPIWSEIDKYPLIALRLETWSWKRFNDRGFGSICIAIRKIKRSWQTTDDPMAREQMRVTWTWTSSPLCSCSCLCGVLFDTWK